MPQRHRHTSTVRHLQRLPALALATVLVGGFGVACSDDGGSDEPTTSGATTQPESTSRCQIDGSVSGADQADLTGEAEVNVRSPDDQGAGPEARYVYGDDEQAVQLSVFSEGPDFEPNLTLNVDGITYTPPGTKAGGGFEADTDGSGAEVDTALEAGDQTVQLQATFSCELVDTPDPEDAER